MMSIFLGWIKTTNQSCFLWRTTIFWCFFHDEQKAPEKWWIQKLIITAMPRKISVIWLPGYEKRQKKWSRDDGKIPMVFHISVSNSMALKFPPFLDGDSPHCFGGVVPCQQSSAPRGRSGLHPFILGRVPWAHGMAMKKGEHNMNMMVGSHDFRGIRKMNMMFFFSE